MNVDLTFETNIPIIDVVKRNDTCATAGGFVNILLESDCSDNSWTNLITADYIKYESISDGMVVIESEAAIRLHLDTSSFVSGNGNFNSSCGPMESNIPTGDTMNGNCAVQTGGVNICPGYNSAFFTAWTALFGLVGAGVALAQRKLLIVAACLIFAMMFYSPPVSANAPKEFVRQVDQCSVRARVEVFIHCVQNSYYDRPLLRNYSITVNNNADNSKQTYFLQSGEDCPDIQVICGDGRPYVTDGKLLQSELNICQESDQQSQSNDWILPHLKPNLDFDQQTLKQLAERWSDQARAEQASVASFSLVTLQLLANGAPASLVRQSMRSGEQEIRHAQLSYSLASAYSGKQLSPGKFEPHSLHIEPNLTQLAVETFQHGCLVEMAATLRAARQLADEKDAVVVQVLKEIVLDEATHAALAWKTVQWAISKDSELQERVLAKVESFSSNDGLMSGLVDGLWAAVLAPSHKSVLVEEIFANDA